MPTIGWLGLPEFSRVSLGLVLQLPKPNEGLRPLQLAAQARLGMAPPSERFEKTKRRALRESGEDRRRQELMGQSVVGGTGAHALPVTVIIGVRSENVGASS